MRLGIVGGGNMGAAYAQALLQRGVIESRADIAIVESREERRLELVNNLDLPSSASYEGLRRSDVILLATKPQDFSCAARELVPLLRPEQLVLSIMAGVTLGAIGAELGGHARLVRAMPNTPVQIGRGMTVYACPEGSDAVALQLAEKVLSATGACLRLQREDLLNAATAVSGSGPAYVFFFIEHMLRAARELGFSQQEADLMVGETLAGALELWRQSGKRPEELRGMVTSKGGTTEAALRVLIEREFGEILVSALKRAEARSKELGNGQR